MSADDDESVEIALIFWNWLLLEDETNNKACNRQFWVHPINEQRTTKKTIQSFLQELRADERKFKNFTRMSSDSFDYLLELISNKIGKKGQIGGQVYHQKRGY